MEAENAKHVARVPAIQGQNMEPRKFNRKNIYEFVCLDQTGSNFKNSKSMRKLATRDWIINCLDSLQDLVIIVQLGELLYLIN